MAKKSIRVVKKVLVLGNRSVLIKGLQWICVIQPMQGILHKANVMAGHLFNKIVSINQSSISNQRDIRVTI
jgi:hypothetical protein